MNAISLRLTSAGLLAACIAVTGGCYPASYYQPANNYSAYNGDSKGGYADNTSETTEVPAQPYPRYAGVDPGLAIAGVAAAGVLGYAVGNNHGHHHGYFHRPYYYGPRYYRPVYYGRPHYARAYYRPHYHYRR